MKIHEKLAAIQREIKAPKNLKNTFGGYMYRNAESILEAFKPYLDKYKVSLVLYDRIDQIGERYYVVATAKLIDIEEGESICATAYARESAEKKGMDDSQITGAASSYARKYALNGLFLLDDTKDADTDEFANQQIEKNASQAQKRTIKSICEKHKIDVNQLCAINSIEWDKITEVQAGKLLNSLKAKFGDD